MNEDTHTTGEVRLNGTSFSYEITGKGHPLVLVHAGIADRHMWDDQIAAFSQHYTVIRYDLRGYGQTAMVAGPFSHHRDLHDLLQFLGIKGAYLLGCSLGGTTVIDLALEQPEMADALILVTSVPGGFEPGDDEALQTEEEASKLQQEHAAAIQRGDIARAAEIEATYWMVGPQRTPDQVDSTLRIRLCEMNQIALANKVAGLGKQQRLDPPAVSRLNEIHIPTLVITGELDDPHILKSGELLATTIAGTQKAIIAGTAHFPNMEQPTEFNRLVLEFLTAL